MAASDDAPCPGDTVALIIGSWGESGGSRCDARTLGTDEWGTWLIIEAGEVRFFLPSSSKGSGPFFALGTPILVLAGPGNWWVASFCEALWKVDVTGPVRVNRRSIEWEDLRLDVECVPGQPARITDQDEYAELELEADVDARAWDAANWAMRAINDGSEPFNSVYKRWSVALDPPVDRTALHGGVLKLHPWDEPAVIAKYGARLVASWKRRQDRGEGLVLVAGAFDRSWAWPGHRIPSERAPRPRSSTAMRASWSALSIAISMPPVERGASSPTNRREAESQRCEGQAGEGHGQGARRPRHVGWSAILRARAWR
ncbi:MAG TPA: hypothetical protein VIA06_08100 [Candidatus Dormibacteraeota bacterium]|nr:hypothetical protein [Candidatus Dormibacteraeota bacterium]